MRDVGDLRREALDVLRLLVEQALGDEQRKVGVDVSGPLELGVERLLNQLPDRVALWPDDHTAFDRRVVGELRAANDIEVPLREVLRAGGDFGDERFFLGLLRHLAAFQRCADTEDTKDTKDTKNTKSYSSGSFPLCPQCPLCL